MSASRAAVVFAAQQCEAALLRGDSVAAGFWADVAFDGCFWIARGGA